MSGSSPRGVDLNKEMFFFSKCVQWKPASNTDLLQCFLKLSPGDSGLDSREQILLLVLLNNLFFHFELAFLIMNILSIHQPLQTTERTALQLAGESGLLSNNHNFTAIKLAQQGWTSCRDQYSKGSPGRLILPVTSMSNESDMPWPIVLTPIQEKVPLSTSSREERVRLDVVSSNSSSSLKRKLLLTYFSWRLLPRPNKTRRLRMTRIDQVAEESYTVAFSCISLKLKVRHTRQVCVKRFKYKSDWTGDNRRIARKPNCLHSIETTVWLAMMWRRLFWFEVVSANSSSSRLSELVSSGPLSPATLDELFDPPLNRSRPAANCEVFQVHRWAGEFGDDRRELVLLKDLLHLLHLHKALC